MICIDNYEATSKLFDQAGPAALLAGRTVIQMSTGTPKEAGDSDIWFRDQGATYLDGAIMVYPETVGTADAQILVAGPEAAFQDCQRSPRVAGRRPALSRSEYSRRGDPRPCLSCRAWWGSYTAPSMVPVSASRKGSPWRTWPISCRPATGRGP